MSIPSAVEAIAAMLGMAGAIKGKPLVEQVNACYAAVFSTNGVDPVATTVVTGTFVGSEVASNLGPAVMRSDGNVRQVAGQPAAPEPAPRSAAGSTTSRRRHPHPHDALWDRNSHPNQGPRADQNLLCLTVCCAGPWLVCPVHCLSAWGCADCVGRLTAVAPCCKDVPCCPCSPNSKNPLWCCAEPLGWASSF